MNKMFPRKTATAVVLTLLASLTQPALAANSNPLQTDILNVARQWAQNKYLSKSDSERKHKMKALALKTSALVKRYPGRVEPLIWDGIVTSERASLTWGLTALNLATAARDKLKKAEKMDSKALDAGAPTSLGVLYYRVPGFPVGWGDTEKARHYLKEAITNAPNSRDAHYFYADFLYEQGDYSKAEQVLKKGLNLPAHPERPLWNRIFPRVMRSLLNKIQKKHRS